MTKKISEQKISKVSKWNVVGLNKVERRKLYERKRQEANTILKKNHETEYKRILNNLMEKTRRRLKYKKTL